MLRPREALLLALALLLAACSDDPAPAPEAAREETGLRVAAGDTPPVVLIVVDTLRADRLGAYGYRKNLTTPQLDRWIGQGRRFDRAYSTSPWTLPSFGSLYTGQLPSRHGAGGRSPGDERGTIAAMTEGLPTLAEILQASGWRTAAVVNNPYLAKEFGTTRGFEHYDRHEGGNNVDMRRADETVDAALRWIDGQEDSAFFLVVHAFDPHMSYDAPEPFRGRFTRHVSKELELPVANWAGIREVAAQLPETERAFISAAYDEEIAFVDQEFGRFLSGLDDRGILDHGLVLFTSDHGEELFEHDAFEHGHAFWDELLRVPLVAWGADVRPGEESTPVSLVDVLPTVLERLDLPTPETGLEGCSLWPNLRDGSTPPSRTLYAEFPLFGDDRKAAIQWPHKLVLEMQSGATRLADLERDPREQATQSVESSTATQLETSIREHSRQLAEKVDQRPAEVSAEVLRRLRTLGYQAEEEQQP